MKTKLLIFLLLLFFIPQSSFSLLDAQTPQELYASHHTIIVGKILDSTAVSQRHTLYKIEVIDYVKNPHERTIIQAVGDGVKDGITSSSIDRIFDINDIVLFYLYHKDDDSFKISPYSKIVEDGSTNPYISSYETPPISHDEPLHLIPNPNPDDKIQGFIVLSIVTLGIITCFIMLFVMWKQK